jgi:hypothetical protein
VTFSFGAASFLTAGLAAAFAAGFSAFSAAAAFGAAALAGAALAAGAFFSAAGFAAALASLLESCLQPLVDLLNLYEVSHGANHAAQRTRVFFDDNVANSLEP